MADHDDSYEIGYRKPPAETRFTKGQSGNPKGRPKGTKNLATLLIKVAQERVRVTISGRVRTMTKLEAILLQLANKAMSGDDRAAKEILHLLSLFEESQQSLPAVVQDEKDYAVLKNILKRIRESDPGSDADIGDIPSEPFDGEK